MLHTRAGLLLALPLLGGCDLIDQGRELFEDLTNALVAEALVLGVTPPEQANGIDLPPELAEGVGATVFLADAGDVTELENAPISGADVELNAQAMTDGGNGSYLLDPGALTYQAGAVWPLSITLGGDTATADVELPPAATFDLPSTIAVGGTVSVDLTGQDFDGALVFVVDQGGNLTYDNRPTDIKGFYELTRGDAVGVVEIPGEAFPSAGGYLVGVAGIRTTKGRDAVEGMNTALSSMMAGNAVFEPLAAAP